MGRPLTRVTADTVVKAPHTDAGEPLLVYHGTHAEFTEFNMRKALDGAHFFTPNIRHAEHFGNAYPFFIFMKNPMEISQGDLETRWDRDAVDISGQPDNGDMLPRDYISEFVEEAQSKRHDGLIIRGFADLEFAEDVFLPFSPGQIKSAFSPEWQQ